MAEVVVVEPAERAHDLASRMADRTDVMRQILQETIESAEAGYIREAGRTVCGATRQIKTPLDRFPSSVSLDSCPFGAAGAWHTHTTPAELKTPQNSLPDLATVAYDELDVVGVVGTETAEFFVNADDTDLLHDRFSEIIGIPAGTSGDVAMAINNGRVNPVLSRKRIYEEFPHLFMQIDTGFDELTTEVEGLFNTSVRASMPYDGIEANTLYYHSDRTWADQHRQQVRQCSHQLKQVENQLPINVREVALGAAVGSLASDVARSIVGRFFR